MPKVQEIFARQLERCQSEYFDFYLFHNVCELNIDAYLNEEYGILDHLLKQKEAGRIRHLGFSAHGSIPVMERFLNAYGEHMEFCQIQLNYLDWSLQDAKGKVELLNARHIPIWVMEPLRGGKLCTLDERSHERAAEAASAGKHERMGIPLPAEHPGRDDDPLRHVGHAAAARKHRDLCR